MEDKEGRHFSIHAPLITCWQYFGTGTAPSFSLCHDLAEEEELVFLQFHLPPSSCSISVKSIPLCFPSHLPPLVLFPLLFFFFDRLLNYFLLQIILQIESKWDKEGVKQCCEIVMYKKHEKCNIPRIDNLKYSTYFTLIFIFWFNFFVLLCTFEKCYAPFCYLNQDPDEYIKSWLDFVGLLALTVLSHYSWTGNNGTLPKVV